MRQQHLSRCGNIGYMSSRVNQHAASTNVNNNNISKIVGIENKINNIWRKCCKDNKIPNKICNMYLS